MIILSNIHFSKSSNPNIFRSINTVITIIDSLSTAVSMITGFKSIVLIQSTPVIIILQNVEITSIASCVPSFKVINLFG